MHILPQFTVHYQHTIEQDGLRHKLIERGDNVESVKLYIFFFFFFFHFVHVLK